MIKLGQIRVCCPLSTRSYADTWAWAEASASRSPCCFSLSLPYSQPLSSECCDLRPHPGLFGPYTFAFVDSVSVHFVLLEQNIQDWAFYLQKRKRKSVFTSQFWRLKVPGWATPSVVPLIAPMHVAVPPLWGTEKEVAAWQNGKPEGTEAKRTHWDPREPHESLPGRLSQ